MEVIIEWYLSKNKRLDYLVEDALLILSDQAMVRTKGNLKRASKLIGVGNRATMVKYLKSPSKCWRRDRETSVNDAVKDRLICLAKSYLDRGILVHYFIRDIKERVAGIAMRKYNGNLSLASQRIGITRVSFSKYLGIDVMEWRDKYGDEYENK